MFFQCVSSAATQWDWGLKKLCENRTWHQVHSISSMEYCNLDFFHGTATNAPNQLLMLDENRTYTWKINEKGCKSDKM